MAVNPYKSRVNEQGIADEELLPTSARSQLYFAVMLALVGVIGGATLYSLGFVQCCVLLERYWTTPLRDDGGYGRFGAIVVLLGFWGACCGASFGLIPLVGFWFWLPLFAVTSLIILTSELVDELDPGDTVFTAVGILKCLTVLLAAILTRLTYKPRRQSFEVSENP